MAKISLMVVVVVSLVVALPWRWAAGQDDSWKSLADQAASQGISQQSIDDAQAALRGAAADDAESSVWADWIKGNADNMGYADESAPTASADGESPSDEPEAEDFADIGVDDSPAVAESPAGTSPTDSPSFAPESQSPAAGADTTEAQAPDAATPAAYSPGAPVPTADAPSAAAPEAQTPGAAAPGAYAPDAATPVEQETGADAPTLEAEAPGAATSPGASSPDAS